MTQIIQDTKILQQILGKMPETGNQINVIMINQVKTGDNEAEEKGVIVPSLENREEVKIFLCKLLDELPQPKVVALKRLLMEALLDRFGSKTEVGKYLQITTGAVSHFVTRYGI